MHWKADLHIHSKYSNNPTNWVMKKLGCAESYTEPKEIYKIAQKKGMKAVTITDHNKIDGCLEILEYPNTFISSEIAVRFPEDNCKAHILTYDITEEQFNDIMAIRNNIYEFKDYIRRNSIYTSVAHPFSAVDDKFSRDHFEKLLLMFNTFEMNGCRESVLNDSLRLIFNNLTREKIEEFANIHNVAPIENAWNKSYTAGSDDHTGIMIARKYTEVEKASNVQELLKGIFEDGQGIVHGEDYDPNGLAHNLYSVAYQYYSSKFDVQKYVEMDRTLQIIDKLLVYKERDKGLISRIISKIRDKKIKIDIKEDIKTNSMKRILYKTVLSKHEKIADDATPENIPHKWFEIANSVSNQSISHMIDYLLNNAMTGNLFDIFHTLGSVGSAYFLMSPYFVSYSIAQKDKDFAKELVEKYTGKERKVKIAHFTDTYYDINGVAKTMQQNLKLAKKLGKDLTLITCHDTTDPDYKNLHGEKVFEPVGQCEIPEYPELKFNNPPFLETLKYCYEQGFTHFHSTAPGTVGLTALAVAKILKKPIYGTYHTAFPQFLLQLTGDHVMEDVAWKYMIWYYNQMDIVYVPSLAMGRELTEKGIGKQKIRLYPRGVDINRFRPMEQSNKKQKGKITLLSVGRVSKEKNLHLLAGAFKKLSEKYNNITLQIVGDGPYREEMQELLEDYPVDFLGYVQGEELIQVYSDADVFVFPSTTDTFGNVALEAQACGTPVIVTDCGGPMENILPNKTGIIVKGEDEAALHNGMKKMLDEGKLEQMSKNCREYMEGRSFENAFLKTWHLYETDV